MAIRLTVNAAVDRPAELSCWTIPTFADLAKEIEQSHSIGSKTDAELLVPVAEWHELHRNVQNIEKMASIFIGDVDRKTDEEIDELLDGLEGASAILYSTHSHLTPKKDGLSCYRVIIELDREYPPQNHLQVWSAVNARLGGHLDEEARTPEQGYYLPASPSGFEHLAECLQVDGQPWCVDDLLAESAAAGVTPSPKVTPADLPANQKGTPPSLVALISTLTSWTRNQKDPDRREVGKAAKALLDGKNLIELHKGQRNGFLVALAGYLAHSWPYAAPEGTVSHFETVGWDLFNDDGKYPLSAFVALVARMQEAEQGKIEAQAEARASERKELISLATGGERDHIITPEEIAHLEELYGDWHKHIVASLKKDLFFLRPDGTYDSGPVMRDMLFVAARDRLAVFGDEVEYTYEDIQGAEKRKTEKMFLEEYATVIRHAAFDMERPRGGWEPETGTIFFECAQTKVRPVEHPEVQEWFNLLDDHLIDMLATIPALGEMLPALVLTGGRNCGKTLLAKGIGQIYGTDPIDGDAAFDKFNASMLVRQPIIFLDECTPEAYKREGTTLLRRFMTQGTRQLDEKYQARVELRGYPRIVIAANNIDVLNTKEEMGHDDREAFAERIMHIDLDPGKDWLDSHAEHIKKHWLKQSKHLSEHILWLQQNHQIKYPGARFAVESNHTKLHDGLASRSGIAGDVAYWLLSFLDSPERAHAAHLPIDISGGQLRVNGTAVVRGWVHYLKDHRSPSPHQIGRALKSMSTGGRTKISITTGGRDRRVDAYIIDPMILRSANEAHGVIENFDDLFLLGAEDNT